MGLYAFLAGVISIVMAWFFGRKKGEQETTTRIKGEVTIQQVRAETAEKEADLMASAAKAVVDAKSKVIEDVGKEIDEARRQGDWDKAKEIAMKMAADAKELAK